ncbi:hypothetical protein [Peribacillus muralis]|uniref:hypothetical protein n=1 Tax=Peribacillus muralis TaxID=264697 RepID=UPI00366E3C66
MYKIRGKLNILNDNQEREITVDNGAVTGDEIFEFEIKFVMEQKEKRGEPIGPSLYVPKGKYIADELAVLLLVRSICTDVKLQGDIPEAAEGEEGVDI